VLCLLITNLMSISKELLKISPLVSKALREKRPVVSL
jgi:hypothetical protein